MAGRADFHRPATGRRSDRLARKMMTATPRCTSDRFSSVPSTASLSSLNHVRAGRSARELETTERVAHKAHSRWDSSKNPGCGLVDNSPEHAVKCEKVLPMLLD